uniref:Uncharacterized protein n=1 Tax=Euplotes crassus TaxID=5936 RepID=A0A7S3KD59_EUPCR|mmetsp:Transcript_1709/g.1663  ORF Transcript_1709/g.1663 Transcript_1709/m.1663 type:complete len:382 (+) Transcript_1709:608-1753(+)
MSNETYFAELNSVLWLTPKQLEETEGLLSHKAEQDIDTVDCEALVNSATEYLAIVQQNNNAVVEKPSKFSKDKYKPSCKKHKATTVSKIYKIFTSESAGNTTFRRKLQQKYGLNEETAKSWLIEFIKFLTLKIIETDPDVSSNSFPSSLVEQVWTTYQELGFYYRVTSQAIFGETHLFPESALTSMHKREETSQRYADTLDFYEKVFEHKPPAEFWETAEERFLAEGDYLDNDNNRRIAVNFYRLLVAKAVDKTLDTSNNLELVVFDGIEGKDYLKSDDEKTLSRESAKGNGKLLDWRVNYPHFSNVYFRHKLTGKKYFPNVFENDYEDAIALAKGGYLFFLDPHNDLTLQLAQLPKLPEVKTKSLDDIADYAETSYSFEE